ncbi:MAG: cation diffusion facilitator family transporter [Chitinophagales bacterium]|nr:cation diffusion facilitator family transporter [Chitinophagales bacterium]
MDPRIQNVKVQQWVAGISVAMLIVKFIAYYSTRSVTILTDALESIVNVVSGFIGLYSLRIAARPRDKDHPYGHGKVEFISAAIEGTLIGSAGVIILYKAIQELIHPVELRQVDIGIVLIAVTAVVNFIMGYYCLSYGKKNSSLALIASGKHLQSDTWSTAGIIIGLIFLYISGYRWIDGVVAILFGSYIIFTSYRILRRSVAGIMDEADMELLERVVQVLNANRRENWIDLHNLRVIKYGSVLHVDCHLTFPWYFTVREAHHEIDELAKLIRKDFGESLELFVHSDGCMPFSCRICYKAHCKERQHPFEKKITWTLENISQNKKHSLD